MAAIEYGSNYFCVMLEATQEGRAGDTVLLHADSIDIDAAGTLKFTSMGRRTVGTDPKPRTRTRVVRPSRTAAQKRPNRRKARMAKPPRKLGRARYSWLLLPALGEWSMPPSCRMARPRPSNTGMRRAASPKSQRCRPTAAQRNSYSPWQRRRGSSIEAVSPRNTFKQPISPSSLPYLLERDASRVSTSSGANGAQAVIPICRVDHCHRARIFACPPVALDTSLTFTSRRKYRTG